MIVEQLNKGFNHRAYLEWLQIHKDIALPKKHKTYLSWYLAGNEEKGRQTTLSELMKE